MKTEGKRFEVPRGRLACVLLGAVLAVAGTGCFFGGGGDDDDDDGPVCGDRVCEANEAATCPADCIVCGNNVCETNEITTCPADCAVCNNHVCEANEATTCPADCTAMLVVRNVSALTVYHLYVAVCGRPWDVDQLGANILYPNYQFTLSNIPPGCYSARAESGAWYWQQLNVAMASGQTYTWTLYPPSGVDASSPSAWTQDESPVELAPRAPDPAP
jgi:hypothetical protein